jgi:hypothetical protein
MRRRLGIITLGLGMLAAWLLTRRCAPWSHHWLRAASEPGYVSHECLYCPARRRSSLRLTEIAR